MTHLVLGSSGQIGAHLVKYLQNKGEAVLEFDIENRPWQDLRNRHNPIFDSYVDACDIVHFLAFDVGGAREKLRSLQCILTSGDATKLSRFWCLHLCQT